MKNKAITISSCLLILMISMFGPGNALATPSTIIWIPSVDVQKFATVHLNVDTYLRLWAEPDGSIKPPIVDIGPTVGILPFSFLQAEIGLDVIVQGDAGLDRYPVYFNAKVAVPEDVMFKWSPAIAVGSYNIGIKWTGQNRTNQNICYGIIGRTVPYLGRLEFGYSWANPDLFSPQNQGFMASWDRTLTEISDKLWVAIDYMGSESSLGAISAGIAWSFAPNASVLLAYDKYLYPMAAGADTITVQADYNF